MHVYIYIYVYVYISKYKEAVVLGARTWLLRKTHSIHKHS